MERFAQLGQHVREHRKWVAVGAAAIAFAAILLIARGMAEPSLALLYSGLDAKTAAGVVAELDARNEIYEVRGTSIYVLPEVRDTLRVNLAGAGLPETGPEGYELLDNLPGFGTTAQMFDATYLRAQEGELARTIMAIPSISAARVHIAAPETGFSQHRPDATASVTITGTGGRLDPAQIRALRFLVASSVAGMKPESVSIIDSVYGLLTDDSRPAASTEAEELRQRLIRLLEPHVGIGNAVVEASVEVSTESETINEKLVDPASRVAISSDVLESTESATGTEGAVTVASNLPDGAANGGNGRSSQNSESRTVTNYDTSQTERQITRLPGQIERITVAVLVNQGAEPRTEEELAALQDLVASAVGFDESRGDVITLRAMSFEGALPDGTLPAPDGLPVDTMKLVQTGTLAAVVLVLGLFVVRPLLLNQGTRALPEPDQPALAALPMVADFAFDMDSPSESPSDRLRRLMDERKGESMRVLQTWIEENGRMEKA